MDNRISELREKMKMTQTKLSKLLNVTPAAISKYENGKVSLTDVTIIQLTEIFGVTSDYLLGLSNEVKESTDHELKPPNYQNDESLLIDRFRSLDRESQLWIIGKTIDMAKNLNNSKSESTNVDSGIKKEA